MSGHPTPRRRTPTVLRRRLVGAGALLVLAVAAVVVLTTRGASPSGASPAVAAGHAGGPESGTASASPSAPPSSTGSAAAPRTPAPASSTARERHGTRPSAMRVPPRGDGRLVAVKGSVPAPGRGRAIRVRVEVEGGVDVAPQEFAGQVMRTLNDDRSWGHGGARSFARTSGAADVVVILANPQTSADLCRPLTTRGRLSCSIGKRAILTAYRWARGTPEFDSLGQYRAYVVNHEVGHVLGHGHEGCPGPGRRAPVMQQQTKQVAPCRPNPWPFP